MSIVDFFNENGWNIVIGIGTGIISSIFVSEIFLIYQDVKGDFVEVVKNTTALGRCKVFYQYYRNPELAKACHIKLQKDGTVSKQVMFLAIKKVVYEEIQELHSIYTKYMDEDLISIKNKYEANLTVLFSECEEQYRREESLEKIFPMIEETLKEFDEYQKNMFKRTITIIFKDKLISLFLVLFAIILFIVYIA